MPPVKAPTSMFRKLCFVSTFAAPWGHWDAVSTVLGGTSPPIHPDAQLFSTTTEDGSGPVLGRGREKLGVGVDRRTCAAEHGRNSVPVPQWCCEGRDKAQLSEHACGRLDGRHLLTDVNQGYVRPGRPRLPFPHRADYRRRGERDTRADSRRGQPCG